MSCRNSQSTTRVIRWPLGLGLLAANACSTAQSIFDLVDHNGFEACWSKAKTKAQFFDLLKSSVDGKTACVLPFLTSAGGFNYDVCYIGTCPDNSAGCTVTFHAGTFGGDFGTGAFSGPGSTSDMSIPVAYDDGGSTSGGCTITITNITQTYSPSFFFQPDGNNGDYLLYFGPTQVTFDTFNASSADVNCSPMLASPDSNPRGMLEALASIEITVALDGTVESVCPLTP